MLLGLASLHAGWPEVGSTVLACLHDPRSAMESALRALKAGGFKGGM